MEKSKQHSASLSVLEEALHQSNITISHVGSISIAEVKDSDHLTLPPGKYSCIDISVFIPIED
ncbi:MAG: hypothetical protein Q8N09_09925 [Thermodesulfovibrionia bacterium]|nr:hypothetical protein [Thermodesulfovibrionia bacterium]